ncbi:MAG: hypothetical protein AAFP85_14585 [Pseudomonadota bacterium]
MKQDVVLSGRAEPTQQENGLEELAKLIAEAELNFLFSSGKGIGALLLTIVLITLIALSSKARIRMPRLIIIRRKDND